MQLCCISDHPTNIATSAPLVKRCLRAGTPLGRCQGRCGISATDLHLSLTYAIYNSTLPQMRPASCYVSCPQRHENLTKKLPTLLSSPRAAKCLISLGKLVNKAKGEKVRRFFATFIYYILSFFFRKGSLTFLTFSPFVCFQILSR